MAISDKTRKALWAASGNRCAICKLKLTEYVEDNKNLIRGKECHIVSCKPKGPRHRFMENYDSYENFILLCGTDHSGIDSNVSNFPEARLHEIKSAHEEWISQITENSINAPELTEPIKIDRKRFGSINIKSKSLRLIGGMAFVMVVVLYISALYFAVVVKASIFDIPRFVPMIAVLLMSLSMFCLFVGSVLSKRKFALLFKNYSLEDQQNHIVLMRTKVLCQACSSEMTLMSREASTLAVCERNPDHTILFDYTKL